MNKITSIIINWQISVSIIGVNNTYRKNTENNDSLNEESMTKTSSLTTYSINLNRNNEKTWSITIIRPKTFHLFQFENWSKNPLI